MKGLWQLFLLAVAAFAQPKAPSTEIRILPVQGNVYMLVGAGGNIAASIGPDGILLVDAGASQMSGKVEGGPRRFGEVDCGQDRSRGNHSQHS
jgi:hypothetical protein